MQMLPDEMIRSSGNQLIPSSSPAPRGGARPRASLESYQISLRDNVHPGTCAT